MTITIPVWVLWVIGIPLTMIILFLAWVGYNFVKDGRWY